MLASVDAPSSPWEAWQQIMSQAGPDPLEVLEVVARCKRYFDAIEDEGIVVGRRVGYTWEQIAAALGQSRQAVWQRAHRNIAALAGDAPAASAPAGEAKRDPAGWYARTGPLTAAPLE